MIERIYYGILTHVAGPILSLVAVALMFKVLFY